MYHPRAPSSPTPTITHHHTKEQGMHYSSSSSVLSHARPERPRERMAGHLRDNDVPTRLLARDIVRGVVEELYGPHPQTHRRDAA